MFVSTWQVCMAALRSPKCQFTAVLRSAPVWYRPNYWNNWHWRSLGDTYEWWSRTYPAVRCANYSLRESTRTEHFMFSSLCSNCSIPITNGFFVELTSSAVTSDAVVISHHRMPHGHSKSTHDAGWPSYVIVFLVLKCSLKNLSFIFGSILVCRCTYGLQMVKVRGWGGYKANDVRSIVVLLNVLTRFDKYKAYVFHCMQY